MGILETEKTPTIVSPSTRRKSGALDFGSLKPLNAATGTKNFGGYRDGSKTSPKSKKATEEIMDSDADDEDDIKIEDMEDDRVGDNGMLSPEDALKQRELAEGVRKIKVSLHTVVRYLCTCLTFLQLKRQHSAEPLSHSLGSPTNDASRSPMTGTPVPGASIGEVSLSAAAAAVAAGTSGPDESSIASPYKKQRASLPGFDDNVRKSLGQALMGVQKERGNSEGNIHGSVGLETKMEEDEEL